MQCPNCGAYITEEDQFCGECGRPLEGKRSSAEPVTPSEAVDQPAEALSLPAPSLPAPAKKRTWVPILVVIGLSLSVLCVFAFGALVWLGIRSGSVPTPAVNAPGTGTPVYQDDFADPGSGWSVYAEDDSVADYTDGEYRVGTYRDNYMAWGNPEGLELANFEAEVDARTVEGPLDNNFGLLVRTQPDDDNFYWFQISADGYYSVDRMQAGEWIGMVDWTESDAINQGIGATNHLKVVCDQELFSFYVNGTYLTGVTDASFSSGNIGLAVGTFDEPGAVVHFDNIVVYNLQE
jgi:hypothetical protein